MKKIKYVPLLCFLLAGGGLGPVSAEQCPIHHMPGDLCEGGVGKGCDKFYINRGLWYGYAACKNGKDGGECVRGKSCDRDEANETNGGRLD
jgi:hypothetical protein